MGVFVVGGFEKFPAAFVTDDGSGGEDFGRMTGAGESLGDFRFERIDDEAAAGRDFGIEAIDLDHGIAEGRAGIEHDVGKVGELASVFTL